MTEYETLFGYSFNCSGIREAIKRDKARGVFVYFEVLENIIRGGFSLEMLLNLSKQKGPGYRHQLDGLLHARAFLPNSGLGSAIMSVNPQYELRTEDFRDKIKAFNILKSFIFEADRKVSKSAVQKKLAQLPEFFERVFNEAVSNGDVRIEKAGAYYAYVRELKKDSIYRQARRGIPPKSEYVWHKELLGVLAEDEYSIPIH